jgi:hypothetical protein
MIHQRFAWEAIVLQTLIEPSLFEDDAVVDALAGASA